ncbi:hypothetical protein DP42_4981 [Burkholderia pseudomallei]|nr:hypothetical protein DP42_4981 [Burkholderia pseudomallei]
MPCAVRGMLPAVAHSSTLHLPFADDRDRDFPLQARAVTELFSYLQAGSWRLLLIGIVLILRY